MKWNTHISTDKDGERVIRGEALSSLVKDHTFTEAIFLLLAERLPNSHERRVFDAMLVAGCEHGVEVPSAFSARVSASVGNPLHVAVAAGILSTGDFHGGAIEEAALFFEKKIPVSDVLAKGKRFPGFGHKVYKDADPRAELLFEIAKEEGIGIEEIAYARSIETDLEAQSGKHFPINIDGALAALMLGLGLPPALGKPLFVLSRLPGMIAHAHEEQVNEKPYRRFGADDVTYTGH